MQRNWNRTALAATVALLLGAQGIVSAQPAQEHPAPPADTAVANTLFNHHADLTSPINVKNVQNIQPAWQVTTKEFVSHTPLVDGDRVYFADWGGTVYAVNAKDGSVVWKKQVQENVKKKWPWHGIAGTGAMSDELLFEASVEGKAWALDKNTGEVVWETTITDDPQAGSLARMLYHNGLVYVGLSSVEEALDKMKPNFEPNFQGKVKALDAKTGEVVWTRPLATPPSTGATVWSSFALDPETSTLYFTTSNNYTEPANDLSDALVAADAKTGNIKWHRQVTEQDIWTMENPLGPDYAFGAGPQLFEAVIEGETRKLVGAGQKSGVFYVWDRETGEPVWTVTVGYGHVGGGIHGEASIGADRIIIWGNNAYPYKNPEQHPMDIKAVNPATGNYLWVKPKAQPAVEISAGFLANDVYFVGSLDGKVRAYNAKNGDKLWTSPQHGSVASSIWADGHTVLWGAGVPKRFGGNGMQPGVFAYTVGTSTQTTAVNLYNQWAGEDGKLTVDEWDTAVDQRFGEQAVNLDASTWDDDGNGVISQQEFQQATANNKQLRSMLQT